MASELPAEQQASYSALIDEILAASDLNTISAKRIRKGLQEKVGYDMTDQKQAITALIMDRFDKFQAQPAAASIEPPPTSNGATRPIKSESAEPKPKASATPSEPTSPSKRKAADDAKSDLSDVADSPPPKKAKKIQREDAEDDAAYARRLQAELNSLNARSTRGGGSKRKAAPAKKVTKAKKKSKAKVGSDEDSEVDGVEKPEKEKKGGFHKQMALSAPLAALLQTPTLSRPQTVKQIWAYVKERDLQDPNDKRQIRCDGPMKAVFKSEKVHMFTMNKVLAQHLRPVEEGEGVQRPASAAEVVKEESSGDDVKSEESEEE